MEDSERADIRTVSSYDGRETSGSVAQVPTLQGVVMMASCSGLQVHLGNAMGAVGGARTAASTIETSRPIRVIESRPGELGPGPATWQQMPRKEVVQPGNALIPKGAHAPV
ncbi:hypothetical protein S7711_11144 [Stachybotrys chartarum IBT 7711]|uniref:Uncharacterized protein n=1 Tax=Stachybotrys chartarum (strain CBS 109288 / IBT 7711) TaxID=1280523 RepID=A0A084AIA4_STACB|nr:hypothetical protein S7711_11144 [Stachybotrys chartarum IBT 7711]KFA52120.1 hypothetical protein S40293_10662 [Stachybotrys chartarum IBT 40293]